MNAIYYQISHSVYSTPETQRQSIATLGASLKTESQRHLIGCESRPLCGKCWVTDKPLRWLPVSRLAIFGVSLAGELSGRMK